MFKTRLRLESLCNRALPSAALANGILTVTGTAGDDFITVRQSGDNLVVRERVGPTGLVKTSSFSLSAVTSVAVNGLGGNDTIDLDGLGKGCRVNAGAGNDSVVGGGRDDTLFGGIGDDVLFGKGGNDGLIGAAGRDRIRGGDGNDSCSGGDGDDDLGGGVGDDDLICGSGSDRARGEAGDDRIRGRGADDDLEGGDGVNDVGDDNGGTTSGGNDGTGTTGGTVASRVEGTISAINTATPSVTVSRLSGPPVVVPIAPTTKLERNDAHVALSAFKVGDAAEAKFDAAGLALSFEATGA